MASEPREILLFSPNPAVVEEVASLLSGEGFDVWSSTSLERALKRAAKAAHDLAIVDVADSSPEAIVRFRTKSGAALLALVANSETAADCFTLGAHDCVLWPASSREILARIKVRLSPKRVPDGTIDHGDLVIDLTDRRVGVGDHLVDLSAREFELLSFLASEPGVTFTADQLLAKVWHSSREWQSTKTVAEHVYRLRRKIERDPSAPRWIVSGRHGGYRFESGGEEL